MPGGGGEGRHRMLTAVKKETREDRYKVSTISSNSCIYPLNLSFIYPK
jgi:hypothetical protein